MKSILIVSIVFLTFADLRIVSLKENEIKVNQQRIESRRGQHAPPAVVLHRGLEREKRPWREPDLAACAHAAGDRNAAYPAAEHGRVEDCGIAGVEVVLRSDPQDRGVFGGAGFRREAKSYSTPKDEQKED